MKNRKLEGKAKESKRLKREHALTRRAKGKAGCPAEEHSYFARAVNLAKTFRTVAASTAATVILSSICARSAEVLSPVLSDQLNIAVSRQSVGELRVCFYDQAAGDVGMSSMKPDNQKSTHAQLKRLASETAMAGWDHEGGVPIHAQIWSHAWNLYLEVKRHVAAAPEPSIGPCGDGTVHLNFDTGTTARRLVIEVHPSGLYWSARNVEGQDTSGRFVNANAALRDLQTFFCG